MANLKKSRKENISGNFFVDDTCIDCGTCYWVAPENFTRNGDQSAVYSQPKNKEEEQSSLRALLSCPTFSIGTKEQSTELKVVQESFPYEISDHVYHMGFHSRSSYGAASYFIKRDEGNILVDSPRYVKKLVKKLQKLGGIKYQFLTHKDDVADTNEYQKDFSSKRIIHHDDITSKTRSAEITLQGNDVVDLENDLKIIPVPGHTKGSMVLLFQNNFLFTGDHLAFSRDLGHLYAFKGACWYDFKIQIKSMERLLEYDFEHVLPGHGAPFSGTTQEVKEQLKKCIQWMKGK